MAISSKREKGVFSKSSDAPAVSTRTLRVKKKEKTFLIPVPMQDQQHRRRTTSTVPSIFPSSRIGIRARVGRREILPYDERFIGRNEAATRGGTRSGSRQAPPD
uniref:Uncharacterized protein n=1 Tax=Vespula pensylvanica TaxID=30213 RepID=A0A834U7F6_VESPE|nr:hypothetical protein H0235_010137 [Vespula pensylvanica]